MELMLVLLYVTIRSHMRINQNQFAPNPTSESAIDDLVWGALNDASRRRMLDLLRNRSMTTNELCTHFEFSRFAVMKHLKTLHKGGLVVIERCGRERINHLNPVPLQTM